MKEISTILRRNAKADGAHYKPMIETARPLTFLGTGPRRYEVMRLNSQHIFVKVEPLTSKSSARKVAMCATLNVAIALNDVDNAQWHGIADLKIAKPLPDIFGKADLHRAILAGSDEVDSH